MLRSLFVGHVTTSPSPRSLPKLCGTCSEQKVKIDLLAWSWSELKSTIHALRTRSPQPFQTHCCGCGSNCRFLSPPRSCVHGAASFRSGSSDHNDTTIQGKTQLQHAQQGRKCRTWSCCRWYSAQRRYKIRCTVEQCYMPHQLHAPLLKNMWHVFRTEWNMLKSTIHTLRMRLVAGRSQSERS